MPAPKLYPPHHPWDLEPHYSRHVSAMTSEELHLKSDIAIQLALRDKQIARLEAELRDANHWRARHSRDAEAFGKQSQRNWERVRELEAKLATLVPGAHITPRSAVQWFAQQMELKLRANDHKGGWTEADGCDLEYLFTCLRAETDELSESLQSICDGAHDEALDEAVDVANFAMMIADHCRPGGPTGNQGREPIEKVESRVLELETALAAGLQHHERSDLELMIQNEHKLYADAWTKFEAAQARVRELETDLTDARNGWESSAERVRDLEAEREADLKTNAQIEAWAKHDRETIIGLCRRALDLLCKYEGRHISPIEGTGRTIEDLFAVTGNSEQSPPSPVGICAGCDYPKDRCMCHLMPP